MTSLRIASQWCTLNSRYKAVISIFDEGLHRRVVHFMKVFEIKGIAGLLVFLGSVLLTLALVLIIPAAFMMVLWNAMVFELLGGPEIGLLQGMLLWVATAIVFKLVFNPQIEFEFKKMDHPPHDSEEDPFGS